MVGTTSRGAWATRSDGGFAPGRRTVGEECDESPGFWLTRFASERTRLARLGRAFDELCIDLRGKRIWGAAQSSMAAGAAPNLQPFDVIVSSLELSVLPEAPSLFSTLKDRLEPGGVLCVFVRTPEARGSELVREDVVWSVAGSIAHAGFDVLFAEGSDRVRDGSEVDGLALLPAALLRAAMRGLRAALEFFTPRRFREGLARVLRRLNVCPRQALVVARRSYA